MAVCRYCGKQRSDLGSDGLCPVCARLTAGNSFLDAFEQAMEKLSGDEEISLQGDLRRAREHISRLEAKVVLLERALHDARAPSPDEYAKHLEAEISKLKARNAKLADENSRLEIKSVKLQRSVVSLRDQYCKLMLEREGVTGDDVLYPSNYLMTDT